MVLTHTCCAAEVHAIPTEFDFRKDLINLITCTVSKKIFRFYLLLFFRLASRFSANFSPLILPIANVVQCIVEICLTATVEVIRLLEVSPLSSIPSSLQATHHLKVILRDTHRVVDSSPTIPLSSTLPTTLLDQSPLLDIHLVITLVLVGIILDTTQGLVGIPQAIMDRIHRLIFHLHPLGPITARLLITLLHLPVLITRPPVTTPISILSRLLHTPPVLRVTPVPQTIIPLQAGILLRLPHLQRMETRIIRIRTWDRTIRTRAVATEAIIPPVQVRIHLSLLRYLIALGCFDLLTYRITMHKPRLNLFLRRYLFNSLPYH